MKEHLDNWDELIKRRAISDLFKIVSKCNDEIAKIVEVYRLKIEKATSELVLYQYTSEEFMQLESVLHLCRQYFTSDKQQLFEEYIGGTPVTETEIVETMEEERFTANIIKQDTIFEYEEGTRLALRLIDKYVEALKHKVLDSASKSMLDSEE
ncbi:hypothetical protein LCGC14_1318920 [marine sediment metagenome]|uniref:Uncharacterized protein n=1 Tax=marine sediment metagenome TaxID=412755 RepID=A0A0F9NME3_9ZZZZ